jgi:uncharacterized protein
VSRARLAAWSVLIALLAALNYYGRFSGSTAAAHKTQDSVYSYSDFVGGMIVYLIWLGVVLWIANGDRRILALRRPRSVWRAIRYAVTAIAAIYIVEAIVSVIPLPQSPGKEQGLAPTHWEPAHAGAFAANIVLFALVAPVVEELTFRGLGQSLLAFLGRWPSMIAVGVSFGLAHGLVEALLVLVPFGIALAWIRDRTDSVYPGMVVHGLFNGIALAASVL